MTDKNKKKKLNLPKEIIQSPTDLQAVQGGGGTRIITVSTPSTPTPW